MQRPTRAQELTASVDVEQIGSRITKTENSKKSRIGERIGDGFAGPLAHHSTADLIASTQQKFDDANKAISEVEKCTFPCSIDRILAYLDIGCSGRTVEG